MLNWIDSKRKIVEIYNHNRQKRYLYSYFCSSMLVGDVILTVGVNSSNGVFVNSSEGNLVGGKYGLRIKWKKIPSF